MTHKICFALLAALSISAFADDKKDESFPFHKLAGLRRVVQPSELMRDADWRKISSLQYACETLLGEALRSKSVEVFISLNIPEGEVFVPALYEEKLGVKFRSLTGNIATAVINYEDVLRISKLREVASVSGGEKIQAAEAQAPALTERQLQEELAPVLAERRYQILALTVRGADLFAKLVDLTGPGQVTRTAPIHFTDSTGRTYKLHIDRVTAED